MTWDDSGAYVVLLYADHFQLVSGAMEPLLSFSTAAQSLLWAGNVLLYTTATTIRCLSLVDPQKSAHFTLAEQTIR